MPTLDEWLTPERSRDLLLKLVEDFQPVHPDEAPDQDHLYVLLPMKNMTEVVVTMLVAKLAEKGIDAHKHGTSFYGMNIELVDATHPEEGQFPALLITLPEPVSEGELEGMPEKGHG